MKNCNALIKIKWKKVSMLSEIWIWYYSSFIIFLSNTFSIQIHFQFFDYHFSIHFTHLWAMSLCLYEIVSQFEKFLFKFLTFKVLYTRIYNNRLNDGIFESFLPRLIVTYLIVFNLRTPKSTANDEAFE